MLDGDQRMVHRSEDCRRLIISEHFVPGEDEFLRNIQGFADICFVRLPVPNDHRTSLRGAGELVANAAERLGEGAILIVFGNVIDLVHVHACVPPTLRYQLWIAIKREPVEYDSGAASIPQHHVGAVVYTKYDGSLRHTKTRLEYTYCPACNKTTKDYGGKKHTYHYYGTLISDIWRDIPVDPTGDIRPVLERFADLFGLDNYRDLRVCDVSSLLGERLSASWPVIAPIEPSQPLESQLLNGDCLEELRNLPDNSVDFAFADPPYNLKKEYHGYADDLKIVDYFKWCDDWISEVARVLRPGCTFALLNIPLWSIRHFLHLETILDFQNWIAWDALSFPVRMIMPAHYTILCFSKGESRPLPGLSGNAGTVDVAKGSATFRTLAPLGEGYCLRANCVAARQRRGVNDRGILSDLWWDVHRLKHNTRRVDHPCQLPPQLMYRLIGLFTRPGEVVLDCFNGAGTTSLAAHQLGRRYIGIEREERYYQLTVARHEEIEQGLDPFRKEDRELTAKNSPVARLKKQGYEVPKKTLQLEVRRVAELLGRLPTRDEMIEHGQYVIRYYDDYFSSWGEVCAAARTTGMTETREEYPTDVAYQPRLF
jgi:DNA modification methylase